jgi:EpsI family protein
MRRFGGSRAFVPAGIMLAGTLFVLNARSQGAVPLAAPLTSVLPQVSGYKTIDQQLSAEEQRVAGMSQYVARMYSRDSVMNFSTFVSYYDRQTQGKTIHSPRNCLPGAGWEVMTAGTATVTVDGAPQVLNRYTLKNQGALAVVYYWYQGRGRIVANEYAVKWNLLRDAALAGHTEEALVRVVVPVAPSASADTAGGRTNFDAAVALGADIAARLATDVRRVLPQG